MSVDYEVPVNGKTNTEAYHLPRIGTNFSMISSANWFS